MKQKADIATDVDEAFDEFVSLWNFKGQTQSVAVLKTVAEQYLNDQTDGKHPKYPSILLIGEDGIGRRTLARALHSSLGQLDFRESVPQTGSLDDDIRRYWRDASDHTTYYINSVDCLTQYIQAQIYKILRNHEVRVVNIMERKEEIISVPNRLVILSATNEKRVLPQLLNVVDIHCHLGKYSSDELFEILKQRCHWAAWQYDKDALEVIAIGCQGHPGRAIRLLQMSYRCMRSKNHDVLCLEDIEKAMAFSPAKNKSSLSGEE